MLMMVAIRMLHPNKLVDLASMVLAIAPIWTMDKALIIYMYWAIFGFDRTSQTNIMKIVNILTHPSKSGTNFIVA